MSDKITGVVIDIPTIIKEKKNETLLRHLTKVLLDRYEDDKPDGWISVAERMPGRDQEVLIYAPKVPDYGVGNFDFDHWRISLSDDYTFEADEVTHWMPLPEPPK